MLFSNYQYQLAACTHPYFKCNWLKKSEAEEAVKKLRQLLVDAKSPVSDKPPALLASDFLDFPPAEKTKPDELDSFMKDVDKSMAMLDNYPQVKALFVKFNTAIPTSAPVERLFSQAALILTVRRNRLSDTLLEILILLKIAKKI